MISLSSLTYIIFLNTAAPPAPVPIATATATATAPQNTQDIM
jgi:hypothetical protein